MREVGTNRKFLVGGVAAIVGVAAVAYTVIATRQVLDEVAGTPKELEVAKARLAPDSPGYLSALSTNWRSSFHRPPAASCGSGATEDLQRATEALEDERTSVRAIGLLETALAKDPGCVGAARLLAEQLSRAALQIKLRGWLARADASPGDAAAQLLAAYYQRAAGDGAGYRAYLERASAANPDQPLLHVAWSYYWAVFADPRSVANQLNELEAEVRVTGDLTAVAGLVREFVELGDDEQALRWCDRYYAEAPGSRSYTTARSCARAAIRWGDAERERAAVDRIFKSRTVNVSPACMHADLAGLYVDACRAADAIAEADVAMAAGCLRPASGPRRSALLEAGRFEEAAASPSSGLYWGTAERINRALALALIGRTAEGSEVARAASPSDAVGSSTEGMQAGEDALRRASVLAVLLDSGPSADVLATLVRCEPRTSESDRLARAAGGYVSALMPEEGRSRLDRALALEPGHPRAWVNRVYQLSLDGRLDAAAEAGEAALAAGVTDGGLLANLGYVYQQLGRCDRAVPLYERARATLPLREANYRNLAKCLDAMGREEEARAVWRFLPGGRPGGGLWIWAVGLVAGVVALYLGGKLALIRLLPGRFGHLRFP